MSCSDSGVAMPSMIGFCRLLFLKLSSCSTVYDSCWPASFGYCASLELPSMPWQAPQTAALPAPAAGSPGLTAAVAVLAAGAEAAGAGAAAVLLGAGMVAGLPSCAITL